MGSFMDQLSLITAPVELFDSDGASMFKGSGFFYSKDDKYFYFVTNWHIVSGRNPGAPRLIGHGYRTPTKMEMRLHKRVDRDDAISLGQNMKFSLTINQGDGDSPRWLEHPVHREKVDVIAMEIERAQIESKVLIRTVIDCDLSPDYIECVADDVFVLGYPWGLHGGDSVLPLYKRGSIASEPAVDQQNLPRFLIDCRTSPSMSGAPVICRHDGYWAPNGKEQDALIGSIKKFVGVYSGRVYDHGIPPKELPLATEIGQVWKAKVISEILGSRTPARPFSQLG
jgi:hypothetical protein